MSKVKCSWCMDSGFIGSRRFPCQRCGPSYKIWKCTHCSAVFRDEAECAEHECFCKKESEVTGQCQKCRVKMVGDYGRINLFCPKCQPDKKGEVKDDYCCGVCHKTGTKREIIEHQCPSKPEVKDKVFCCKHCWDEFTNFDKYKLHEAHCKGEPCIHPAQKGKPSGATNATGQSAYLDPMHSIELTEEDIGVIENAISRLWPTGYDLSALRAKLRPKKESVSVKVGDYTMQIDANHVGIAHYSTTSYSTIFKGCSQYSREQFDALIAAYEARKDEVKDGLG